MWTCPKCGREFRKTDQHHFCGKPPETIEEYIAAQPESRQPYLRTVHETMRSALPETVEKISWSMPTFWKGCNIIHFSANQKHVGIYPGPAAVEHFAPQLSQYRFSKGSIQIPYTEEMPTELIREICIWCLETGNHA